MRITPRPIEIAADEGFGQHDIFNYKGFGTRLGNLIQNIDHSATILLDGPWGSGKSIFAQQWAGQCRNNGAKVIYFDAFKNDFHSDAFMAITSQIIKIAEKEKIGNKQEQKNLISKSVELGKKLMPIAARIGTRAATLGILDTEILKDAGIAGTAAIKELGKQFENTIEEQLKEKLINAQTEEQSILGFRKQLGTIASKARNASKEATSENQTGWPLIFIIDELDRCKPSFALEVIENIKHLFSVDNVCFLIVTNTNHLEEAIGGLYGLKDTASRYLQKFYDLQLQLPTVKDKNLKSSIENYSSFLWHKMELHDHPQSDKHQKYLKFICPKLKISFRDLNHIISNIALVLSSSNQNVPILLVYLAIFKTINRDLYNKIKINKLYDKELLQFLDFEAWIETTQNNDKVDYHRDFWNYVFQTANTIDGQRANHFHNMLDFQVIQRNVINSERQNLDHRVHRLMLETIECLDSLNPN